MVRFKQAFDRTRQTVAGGRQKAKKGSRRGLEGFSCKTGRMVAILLSRATSQRDDEIELKGNAFFEALVGSLQINFGILAWP